MTPQATRERRVTLAGVAALAATLAMGVGIAWASVGGDQDQQQAILFAAVITGFAAISGWIVGRWSRGRGPATALAGGLGSTLVRLAPMLAALGWVTVQESRLRDAGAAGWLVALYLPLLAADILLMVLAAPGDRPNGGDGTGQLT
jgi:uncharacterized membrane protein YhaH (DUF805 family)